jgi:hypothetical protein
LLDDTLRGAEGADFHLSAVDPMDIHDRPKRLDKIRDKEREHKHVHRRLYEIPLSRAPHMADAIPLGIGDSSAKIRRTGEKCRTIMRVKTPSTATRDIKPDSAVTCASFE